MKTKIYAIDPIKTPEKTFRRGEIIAEIDAPLTAETLVNLLTSGQASPAPPVDPEPGDARREPTDARPKAAAKKAPPAAAESKSTEVK